MTEGEKLSATNLDSSTTSSCSVEPVWLAGWLILWGVPSPLEPFPSGVLCSRREDALTWEG